ncbi:MAG: DUF4347 domain-containing protein [Spirulina sp. SIO3F2]|nr:DUF4347 domain-containing protein [Spirulina sp. SIO3F2]
MLKTALFAALPLSLWAVQPLYAQSITTAPDGTSTIIQHQGNTYHIQGGTQAGANLFHSFQDFGLSTGEIANFLSNPSITNIFGRVTGGNASIINGLIQANPNLYLMNPAGIVFGANASLNVGGDFFATTADRICFEGGCFNSVGVNDYPALLGSPTTLGFLQGQPGGLVNAGTLEVHKGKSIHLSGGTVVNLGQIWAPGGMATVAAVPGERRVLLNQPGQLLSLEVTEAVLTEGIEPLALPDLLAGASENFQAKVIDAPLGNVAIEGVIAAEQIDLYAAGQVTPTDYELLQGDTTVVRFPEADGQIILSIIDAHADNAQDLLFGGAPGTIATIIERTENGIEAINETLDRIDAPLDGMAITAEGNAGDFWLGNQWLTAENITDYQQQLQAWGNALTESADLLLYSCFTALGTAGEELIASIAELTEADVAASTNATGSTDYGADWVLETHIGNIETTNPFTTQTLANWQGKLLTRTVTNNANAGSLTLRDALTDSGGGFVPPLAAGDRIEFNLPSPSNTITLSSEIVWATNNLTIDGANGGGAQIVVDGGGAGRIFNISASNATISELTIRNGSTSGNGGGIFSSGAVTLTNSTVSGNAGGGIASNGAVTLTNSTVSGNSEDTSGGGIASGGAVTLTNSTVSGNSANGVGGGISSSGAVTLTNSTVSGNSANSSGGGIASVGAVTLTNSTVSGNSSITSNGGGISSNGAVTLTNSTVSGNSSNASGGGIQSLGAITLTNSTVSGNSTNGAGGGIRSLGDAVTLTNATIAFNTGASGGGLSLNASSPLSHTIANSIIANNSGTNPSIRTSTSGSSSHTFDVDNSLIEDTTDATNIGVSNGVDGNLVGVDPLLNALTNNGGNTQTHALQAASPALNAGSNALISGATTDQRGLGFDRISGIVDMGAFESQLTLTPTAGNNQSTTVNTNFSTNLQVTLQDEFNANVPSAGTNITFTPGVTPATASFTGSNIATTNVSGVATVGTLQANTVTGDHTVTATWENLSTTFDLTNTPDAVNSIAISNGNSQTATVATAFANNLEVTVRDQFGNLIPNATINFNGPGAGASLSSASQSVTTDANGLATLTATANTIVGSYTVQAESNSVTADFSLTNTVDVAANLNITGGDNQSTVINTPFAGNLEVQVTDQFGNPISGATVTLTAPGSGASGTPANTSLTTDANGNATTSVTANAEVGSYTIAADSGSLTPVDFNLSNTTGNAANVTILSGNNQSAITNQTFNESLKILITDDFGNLLANQTITFAVPTSGASAILSQSSVTTDSNGFATVSLSANGDAGSYIILVNVDGTNGSTLSLTNDIDTDSLQYLVDDEREAIDALTGACQAMPAVAIELEFSSDAMDALERNGAIALNEQCLPVAGD